MKKNLILFGLLITLILGTYIFQEQKTVENFKESFTKDHLVRVEEMTSLSWGDVSAVKKNGSWWSGDRLLSTNKFKILEKKIAQIKKLKSIQGEKKNFFTGPTEFTLNGVPWAIGDLTLDRQGFYVSRGEEVMVAVSEGESHELAEDPEKITEGKLKNLKQSFTLGLNDLYETQLFRYYPKLPLGTLNVDSDGRPGYVLDFDKNATRPAPIPGVQVHKELLGKFTSLLTQATIKKEVPYSEDLKFSKIGELVFKNEAEEVIRWELWLSSKNSADSYIIDSQKKKAWLMSGGTLKVFFIQVQDYWDKKVIPPDEFKNFSRLKTRFTQGEKSAVVEVINREPFAFEVPDHKVDPIKMNILFQYVLNLSEKDQADRVSPLSPTEKKLILSESHLRLEVFGQDLLFWRKADELILVNLTQGFKSHFFVADQSFRASFEDVLK